MTRADHLLLLHCGYPMVQMNVAHVKDFDADPREIGERACAWFHEPKLPFVPMARSDRAARFAPALRDTPAVTLLLGSLYERMGFAWSHDYARWTPPGQPVQPNA